VAVSGTGFLLEHGLHLLALLAVASWFGVARLGRWRRGRPAPARGPAGPAAAARADPPSLAAGAAVATGSLVAALVHASVIGEHLRESWWSGVFFVATAIAQLAWAVAVLRRPGRPLLAAGAAGNGLVVAVWLVSRTVGLPVGPEPGVPETVGVPDALATAAELVVVLGSMLLLLRRTAGGRASQVSGLSRVGRMQR
jgi:hypothetical protein